MKNFLADGIVPSSSSLYTLFHSAIYNSVITVYCIVLYCITYTSTLRTVTKRPRTKRSIAKHYKITKRPMSDNSFIVDAMFLFSYLVVSFFF